MTEDTLKMKYNIGFIGLGKLGLPVALAIGSKGHNVVGYDINPEVENYILNKKIPYQEILVDELFETSTVKFKSIHDVVNESDIIFVPIQTPHDPQYEGTVRIPDNRIDFNYDFLVSAVENISKEVDYIGKEKIVVIISTVLPGTIEKYIKPKLSPLIKLCYNPFFIAMGTTVRDFLSPEFVLFGVDDPKAAEFVEKFYWTLHSKRVFRTSVKNAELIKVAYNTFIGMKVVYANTMMEICQKTGCDVDVVIDAISLADERLMSPRYLRGGMGDGGGCHPRDNIAMSWLARELELSHDFFEDIMVAREDQTEWLADLCIKESYGADIIIIGKSFKPETNIQTGSPSVLLYNILVEKGVNVKIVDLHIDGAEKFKSVLDQAVDGTLFFIGTQHAYVQDIKFSDKNLVIDPFRYLKSDKIKNLIKIGKGI